MQNKEGQSVTAFAVLVAAYLTLNSALNLLNKWALGVYGFRFPFLLTSAHMAFSFVVLAPIAMKESWKSHQQHLERQWKGIFFIGAFLALNIGLNNISLLEISLSLNQVIRSSIPVVTCILGITVENRIPTKAEATSLVVLTLGVMIAVWQGSLAGQPWAIVVCIIGTISNGAMMTFSGKVLAEKLDVVRLTFYTAPVSCMCLMPFYWTFEKRKFAVYFAERQEAVVAIILVTSIIALCYNMVHSLMIKRTSAVTTTVLGEVKIVGLLMLSALLLGEGKEFNFKMVVGCTTAMVGFCMYSHTKIVAVRMQQAKAAVEALKAEESEPLKHERRTEHQV